jgi:uncharacterized protein (DUF1800 family)
MLFRFLNHVVLAVATTGMPSLAPIGEAASIAAQDRAAQGTDEAQHKLVFVAPAEGAVVQGLTTVGVELHGVDADAAVDVRLHVPGLGEIPPLARVGEGRGIERRYLFEVDAASVPEGAALLRLEAQLSGSGLTIAGEKPLLVRAVHGKDVQRAEAEAQLSTERPEGFGTRHPNVASDPDASGGMAVVLRGYGPTALHSFDLEEGGRYQPFVVARGSLGAGAYPSVAISLGSQDQRVGSVRVVADRWHRIPVGLPIELPAGDSILAVRHANPINEGRSQQRHLYVDSMELVRVSAPTEDSGGTSSMMSMEPAMMSASMMSMQMMGEAGDATPMLPGGLWIGFQEVFDGLPMNGDLRIEGKTSWRGGGPVPRVALFVDGEAVGKLQGTEPVFELSRDELGPGRHGIQLRATQPGGRMAMTPVQTLEVLGRTGPQRASSVRRIGMADEAWVATGSLSRPTEPVTGTLELPESLAGPFEVRLDARGPGDSHHGEVSVRVEGAPDAEGIRPVLAEQRLEVKNWWNERRLGQMTFEEGPKRVVIEANPQPDGAASEKPQLYLRCLVFENLALRPERDVSPPGASIAYPAEGGSIDPTLDAVVAHVFDDARVKSVELLVDGRAVSSFARVRQGVGYAVLPLFSHRLSAGEHELRVRAFDEAGNEAESSVRSIQVPASDASEPSRFTRAVHLLDRLGFGPDPAELAEVLVHGEDAWMDRELDGEGPGHRTARGRARSNLGAAIPYGASSLALQVALSTDQPLRERFALFLDNHFSTWAGKTGMPSEWGDHRRYQEAGLAPFRQLLDVALTSPVMLVYLDQQKSFRGRLNENLARELLELHTVGVNGGYGQDDVTALASLLCGLTVAEEAPPDGSGQYLSRVFRFAPDLADPAAQTVMGKAFGEAHTPVEAYRRFESVLDHLASHPMTAQFMAKKFAEHFVSVPAPADLVSELARVFEASGGDPKAMLRAIPQHTDFWTAMDTPRVTSPLDFGLRFARATAPKHLHSQVDTLLKSSGMGLFDHPTPDGYPEEDEAWIDSNGLLARWRLAQSVTWAARALAPEEVRRGDVGDSLASWSERAIDHAAFRLLGKRLSEESRLAAVDYAREIGEEPLWKRVDQLCVLLTRFPEANLR